MVLIFGPRLDRPSAIGDEGRPRATGLGIAALVTVGLFVATAYAADLLAFAPSVALVVSVTVAGAALLERDRFGILLLAHLSFLPAASALLGLVTLSYLVPSYGLVMTGFAVALLGIAGSWANVFDGEHVTAVATETMIAYGSMLVSAVVFAFVGGIAALLWGLIRRFAGGVGPSASVVGFLPLLCAVSVAVRVALWALPVVQLAPASRRPEFAARAARWERAATAVAVACLVLTMIVSILWVAGTFEALYAAVPPVAPLFAVLSSPFVAVPTLVVGGVALLLSVCAWLARWLTRETDAKSTHRAAAVLGGGLLVVAMLPLVVAALSGLGLLAVFVGIVFAVLGPPLVLATLAAGLVLAKLGVLPVRAAGPAMAGAGLLLAALGAGLAGLPGPVVFACAAGALVIWDAASFALGVTAELGHVPETRRLELFHGVIGVGLAAGAVVATGGLDFLRAALASADGTVAAGAAAVFGVLLLLALLRG